MSYRELTKAVKLEAGFTAFWGPKPPKPIMLWLDERGLEAYRHAYVQRAVDMLAERDIRTLARSASEVAA